jgi:ABC-type nitrate/sulfonate/bicarbonate transport system substrate-binding protein
VPEDLAQRAPAPLTTLRQATLGILGEAAAFVALERGYFAAEGLAIELVNARATDQILLGLTSGQIMVFPAPLSPALFNALARGLPLKLVAPLGTNRAGASSNFLMVRAPLIERGEIADYADLRGRRLGIPANSVPAEYVLETALGNGGLRREEVEIVELGGPEAVTALANGAVDVAIVAEPNATTAEDLRAAEKWKSYGDVCPGLQAGAVVYGPALAGPQAEAGRGWMVAYARGVREYTSLLQRPGGRQELATLLAAHLPVRDRQLFERMSYVDLDPSLLMNEPSLAALLAWSTARGLVTGPADLASAIDAGYVQYALDRLGSPF